MSTADGRKQIINRPTTTMTDQKPAMSRLLQIIDANLNRCSEGLRVIEEIARFILGDEKLQRSTKRLRHELAGFFTDKRSAPAARIKFVASGRDSERDVGRQYSTRSEMERADAAQILKSSFSRAEESARVLEEFTKMLDTGVSAQIKRFRFKLYTLEKGFVAKHLASSKREFFRSVGFYPIIDRRMMGDCDAIIIGTEILSSGVKIMQYHDRIYPENRIYRICKALAKLCRQKQIKFIVGGSVDIALASGADGVHLYQDDLPVDAARQILGPESIVGISAHNKTELRSATKQEVDYIAVGPVFPTKATERRSIGAELAGWARQNISLPIIASGGITLENIDDVIAQTPCGVAVGSGLFESNDIHKQTIRFMRRISKKQQLKP